MFGCSAMTREMANGSWVETVFPLPMLSLYKNSQHNRQLAPDSHV